jgi:hypothetical protein
MLRWLLHTPRVPFIAPRQLGAVGGQLGRQFLPSVEWRTGQSGAPPDRSCRLSGARSPSKFGISDHCSSRLIGAPDTVRCTSWPLEQSMCRAKTAWPTVGSPDSPVHHRTVRWILAIHRWSFSRERRVRRRWLTGQSGAPRDSPVIFSRTPSSIPESIHFTGDQPSAPDTVQCTTGQSCVLGRAGLWLHTTKSFAIRFFSSQHCF